MTEKGPSVTETGRVCSLCGGSLDVPDSSCEGHAAPLVTRGEKDDGPWDEDGYCHSCGNGRWKYHAPDCAWADARDSKEDVRCEVARSAATRLD